MSRLYYGIDKTPFFAYLRRSNPEVTMDLWIAVCGAVALGAFGALSIDRYILFPRRYRAAKEVILNWLEPSPCYAVELAHELERERIVFPGDVRRVFRQLEGEGLIRRYRDGRNLEVVSLA